MGEKCLDKSRRLLSESNQAGQKAHHCSARVSVGEQQPRNIFVLRSVKERQCTGDDAVELLARSQREGHCGYKVQQECLRR